MTKDDIIRMAREAYISEYHLVVLEQGILRFAHFVAAAEREACAKLLDEMAAKDKLTNYYTVAALTLRERGAP